MSPSFAELGVAPDAVSDLAARGITEPFAIQVATLPDALAGRDVAGKAPTGSGKTLAFGLPLVDRCGTAKAHRPSALVLVPTRELAGQVADELRQLARSHGLRVAAVYGGVGFGPQRKALREAVEILVACPGRLVDLIQQGDVTLDGIEVVVLDEADRMADMGFLPEVKRLLDQMPTDRQTLLFSATLDGDVDVLIRNYQRNPARHELEGDDGKLPDATHLFWRVGPDERIERCADVIKASGPTIVFCRTRHGAERLAKRLGSFGVDAVAIHGDRSQNQREKALRDFTDGRALALVATDVAARGIHVDDVAAVIHYDPPADHKDYVHRSGRTARAGTRGTVVSFVLDAHRGAITKLQKALGLPTGSTPIDLSVIPAPVPRATKPRRDRQERPRNDRAPASRGGNDRPARARTDDRRWDTDKAARPTGPRPKPAPTNRAQRRAAEFADTPGFTPSHKGAEAEATTATTDQDDARPATSRPPSTLRSRQAEQPDRRTPDGEARPDRAQRPRGANQHGEARPDRAQRPRAAGQQGQQGMLRFYDEKKGFGFIIRPGAPDLFVHASALVAVDPRELNDGRAITYRVEQGRNGDQAADVRLAPRTRQALPERPSPRPGARPVARTGPRKRR